MADDDDDLPLEALERRQPLKDLMPSGRWPYEPPGPDVDPGAGVREPRRPLPKDAAGEGEPPPAEES